jgi:hypothetical protein
MIFSPLARWRGGPHRRHWSSIYPSVVDELAALHADILITHEAPSCHPNGFALIDDLALALGVKAVFHGHHRDRLDYSKQWERMGFRAFGVGLRGITDQEGVPIVPGDLDYARRDRQRFMFDDEED